MSVRSLCAGLLACAFGISSCISAGKEVLTDLGVPTGGGEAVTWTPHSPAAFEGLPVPTPVNYVAKGANLYELGYRLHGSIAAISHYVETAWLWERVRAQGGAYGGSCTFDHPSGLFTYLS